MLTTKRQFCSYNKFIQCIMSIHSYVLNWPLIFTLGLRFPPGKSIATVLNNETMKHGTLRYDTVGVKNGCKKLWNPFSILGLKHFKSSIIKVKFNSIKSACIFFLAVYTENHVSRSSTWSKLTNWRCGCLQSSHTRTSRIAKKFA